MLHAPLLILRREYGNAPVQTFTAILVKNGKLVDSFVECKHFCGAGAIGTQLFFGSIYQGAILGTYC